jgi:hypothetical protein
VGAIICIKSPSLMASSSEDDDIDGDCGGDAGRGGGGDGSAALPGFCNSGSSSIYYMYLLFYVSSIYVGSPVAIKPI